MLKCSPSEPRTVAPSPAGAFLAQGMDESVDLPEIGRQERPGHQLARHEGTQRRADEAGMRTQPRHGMAVAMGMGVAHVELHAEIAEPRADDVEGVRVLLAQRAAGLAHEDLRRPPLGEPGELDLDAHAARLSAKGERDGQGEGRRLPAGYSRARP